MSELRRRSRLGGAGTLAVCAVLACGLVRGEAGAQTQPTPGYAVGRVLAADGRPISAPGARVVLAIHGTSDQSGQRVEYNVPVRADGSYQQRLAEGSYHVFAARVHVPFGGKTYMCNLEPDTDDQVDRPSSEGIVINYVWKARGAKPGRGDETSVADWYGSSVGMTFSFYRNDLRRSVPAAPKGTRCVFTLTPVGRIIDGSAGEVRTYQRAYDRLLPGLDNPNLTDLPIGIYTIRGEEIQPDGTRVPLLVAKAGANATYGETAEVRFEPTIGVGCHVTPINFTRPVQ